VTTQSRTDDSGTNGIGTLSHVLLDTADRLRRLPESRLNKVATAARGLTQSLADAAAGIEARDAAAPPAVRVVPALSVFAIADQVTVTAHDLRAAAAGLAPEAAVWWDGARTPVQDVLEALVERVEQVRAQV
jgi:hypothetical protein